MSLIDLLNVLMDPLHIAIAPLVTKK